MDTNTLPASLPDADKLAALVAAYPHPLTLLRAGPCEGYAGQYDADYANGAYKVTFGYYCGSWSLWAD